MEEKALKTILLFGYPPDEHVEIYNTEEEAFKDGVEVYGVPTRMFKGFETQLTFKEKD
jgi:hypothetical protein